MSGPDAPPPPAPEALAPPAEAAPVPSGPYRVPEPPPPEPRAEPLPPFTRAPRPILGGAISVFAALLWAFVVFGQLTTSWLSGAPLEPALAIAGVVLATGAAFVAATRRGRQAAPPATRARAFGRALAVVLLAFAMFGWTLFVATALGVASRRGADFPIAAALALLSLVAAIAGPRVTSAARPERTPAARVIHAALWIAGTVLTLVAGLELAWHG
jgi:hypothetical protein